uniref:Uncharacterized protein n=1 Tax=Rhizophora mucronata TaxID=61149 RepID=A0A2P2QH01_RHIMU
MTAVEAVCTSQDYSGHCVL